MRGTMKIIKKIIKKNSRYLFKGLILVLCMIITIKASAMGPLYTSDWLTNYNQEIAEFKKGAVQSLQEHEQEVARGKIIIAELLKNDETRVTINWVKKPFDIYDNNRHQRRKNYLQAIIDVMWFLYAQAVDKNQPFEEGTFTYAQPVLQKKFFEFLKGYVDFVAQDTDERAVTDGVRDTVGASKNHFAASRVSTHFKERGGIHYGIDMVFEKEDQAQEVLPNNNTHILFGETFVKLEDHGVRLGNGYMSHAFGFIDSVKRKVTGGNANDIPIYRKEHVPQDVLSFFDIILDALYDRDTSKIQEEQQEIKKHGISHMIQLIAERDGDTNRLVLKENNKLNKDLIQKFLDQLAHIYDHLEFRKGREVIFSIQELLFNLKAPRKS